MKTRVDPTNEFSLSTHHPIKVYYTRHGYIFLDLSADLFFLFLNASTSGKGMSEHANGVIYVIISSTLGCVDA